MCWTERLSFLLEGSKVVSKSIIISWLEGTKNDESSALSASFCSHPLQIGDKKKTL